MDDDKAKAQYTGLILLSGVDKPGITQGLFEILAPFAITVLDIEQVVIKDRLILTVLIGLNPAHQSAIESDLDQCALDLEVDIATLFSDATISQISSKSNLVHVAILARTITPLAIAQLSAGISSQGGNIERITRTASHPVTALELLVSGCDQTQLSSTLGPIAAVNKVDIAVQPGGILKHARKLIQLDVDSTLIAQEVIDLLAAHAGVSEQVVAITESAMRGEIDFSQSLISRVALLAGLPENVLQQVSAEISLTPGARTLVHNLHKLGHTVAVVSGGFIDVIGPLLQSLQISHFKANKLEIIDGKLSGRVVGTIIDRAAKADALREFAQLESIAMSQTVAIGDGANDLDMIAAAGLGIAFNAKPAVRAAADSSLTDPYLDSVLYLLGIPIEDIEFIEN